MQTQLQCLIELIGAPLLHGRRQENEDWLLMGYPS